MISILLELIPDHCTYVEPFAGSAALFFSKPLADKNIIADIDLELINFYHTIRDIPKEDLFKQLDKMWIVDESLFYDYRDKVMRCRDHNACTNNPDRAIIFLYVNQLSYGCRGNNFGFKKLCKHCDYQGITKLISKLEEYQQLLKNAEIIQADYKDSIQKYDSVCTFFYLDPPYYKPTGKIYNYHDVDPNELAALLRTIRGKFLLSYDNTPELYDIFNDFEIIVIDHEYTLANFKIKGGHQKVKELLISNYPISKK